MVVGVCRIVLSLPWNDSLKGKRAVVKRIVERARVRFHVAAAEVADLDAHRRATLGFAVVSNDARLARSILDKLTRFVATDTEAQLIERDVHVEHYEDSGLGVLGTGSLGTGLGSSLDDFESDDDGDDEEE